MITTVYTRVVNASIDWTWLLHCTTTTKQKGERIHVLSIPFNKLVGRSRTRQTPAMRCSVLIVVVVVVMPQVVGAVVAFGECMAMAWKQNKLFYLKPDIYCIYMRNFVYTTIHSTLSHTTIYRYHAFDRVAASSLILSSWVTCWCNKSWVNTFLC